ncbi:phosphopantothenoylcysteine decarboxylase, partial [bacterium]|nr:phosphopantothenoylcysteine decarboxylase [bacterium]
MAAQFGNFEVTRYEGPADYGDALKSLFPECTVFFSLAAVLDFEVLPWEGKLQREELGNELSLRIRPVLDYAAWAGAGKQNQTVIAFCAEALATDELLKRAEHKRAKKNADAIVANPVATGLGPEASDNELWLLRPGQPTVHLGPAPKEQLALPLLTALFGPA